MIEEATCLATDLAVPHCPHLVDTADISILDSPSASAAIFKGDFSLISRVVQIISSQELMIRADDVVAVSRQSDDKVKN